MRSPNRICCTDAPDTDPGRPRQDHRGQAIRRRSVGQFSSNAAEGFCILRWMHELVSQQIWAQRSFVARPCISILDASILSEIQGLLFRRRIPFLAHQQIETAAQTAQNRVHDCLGIHCASWMAEIDTRSVG